jgi:predicted amidophosphoribosyltransferase
MFCKNCGDKLGSNDRFCGTCGTPKIELCPTCGQTWDKGAAEEEPVKQSKGKTKEPANSKSVFADPVSPKTEPQLPVSVPEPTPPPANNLTSARVQPIYGKQYELGKDCPNCGEKGQKGKKCSTCKGTF